MFKKEKNTEAVNEVSAAPVRVKRFIRDYDAVNKQVIISLADSPENAIVYAPALPESLHTVHVAAILSFGANNIISDVEAKQRATGSSLSEAFSVAAVTAAALSDGTYRTRMGSTPATTATSEDKYNYILANVDKFVGFREENRDRILAVITKAWEAVTTSPKGNTLRTEFAKICRDSRVKPMLDAAFPPATKEQLDLFGL